MAKSKEDIKYGAAQAKLSEDESLRLGYIGGTPIEAGKITDSEPVDLFTSAHRVAESNTAPTRSPIDQSQSHTKLSRESRDGEGGGSQHYQQQ
ncbi:hypothetical protein Sjap_009397 [Stephania japonica]|uniref:Seed maturation protein n=1 Tax=Stephania japonica TaxID=461633 RepID=A0AAP0PBP6_9MAGN